MVGWGGRVGAARGISWKADWNRMAGPGLWKPVLFLEGQKLAEARQSGLWAIGEKWTPSQG